MAADMTKEAEEKGRAKGKKTLMSGKVKFIMRLRCRTTKMIES